MRTPEGAVKDEIKAYLDRHGAYYFMPVQTGYGVRGTPDFLVCWQGEFVAIEAKAPGAKPSKFQELTLKRIAEARGTTIVAHSAADVEARLGSKF